ncbi:MAG: DUF5591 domain-containing protein [Candidatus Thermoplasmatota archaeon]|nr:DUF5591 domain-containing protein [Candidatus Thermoplasmatota archaeon]
MSDLFMINDLSFVKNFEFPAVLFSDLPMLEKNDSYYTYSIRDNTSHKKIFIIDNRYEIEIPVPFIDKVSEADLPHIFWNHSINMDDKAIIIPFLNMDEIFTRPSAMRASFEKILSVKKHEHQVWAMNVALPNRVALLTYLNVSIFDSTLVDNLGNNGIYIDDYYFGKVPSDLLCRCKSCLNGKLDNIGVIQHNRYVLYREVERVKQFIKAGQLRSYVEQRVAEDPAATAVLKEFNINGYAILEKYTPVVGKFSNYVTDLSFNRPEVVRFRNRISNISIKPDKNIDTVILFPCSKRKPYSLSKTHGIFSSIISETGMRSNIHELMITSPLSVVPRELENYYPAMNYDTPVTGYWDEIEKKVTSDVLENYLKRNKYKNAIIHLHGGEVFVKEVVEKYVDNVHVSSDNNPLSDNSLHNLKETLIDLKKNVNSKIKIDKNRGSVKSMFTFQFGKDITDGVNVIIKGYFPEYRIIHNNRQLAMFNAAEGKFSLTLDGAELLLNNKINVVEIENLSIKGDIFSPAVIRADSSIRSGDEVVAVYNDTIKAIGVAKMNGEEMERSRHGLAIKVRTHV